VPAEWLHAHHRADQVAIDVDVAGIRLSRHAADCLVDARVDAEG
jgi:hypothetical protein